MRRPPFAMVGALQECFFFNFSVPAECVRGMVPDPFELVTYQGHAFWNVMAVQRRHVRPWPLPTWVGLNYLSVTYRLLVRYPSATGESVRGVLPIRSDDGGWTAALLGKWFGPEPHYKAQMAWQFNGTDTLLSVRGTAGHEADAEVCVDVSTNGRELPEGSRFHDYATASELLNIAPTDLAFDVHRQEIVAMCMRCGGNWNMQPVRVKKGQWNYLLDDRKGGSQTRAEPCFRIGPMVNCWKEYEVVGQVMPAILPGPISAMPMTPTPLTRRKPRTPAAGVV